MCRKYDWRKTGGARGSKVGVKKTKKKAGPPEQAQFIQT